MKSSVRLTTAAAIALSAIGLSTAFAATYVPHEDNYGLSTSVTRITSSSVASPTDSRLTTGNDATQSTSAKKASMTDNTRTFRREEIGSAK